jgi:hypothetical protein
MTLVILTSCQWKWTRKTNLSSKEVSWFDLNVGSISNKAFSFYLYTCACMLNWESSFFFGV